MKVKNTGCMNSGDTAGHFVGKDPKTANNFIHNRAVIVYICDFGDWEFQLTTAVLCCVSLPYRTVYH